MSPSPAIGFGIPHPRIGFGEGVWFGVGVAGVGTTTIPVGTYIHDFIFGPAPSQ